jgi:hypothetical protein
MAVVLTVAKIPSGVAAGYADYLEGKTQAVELGDYYLKDGERVEAPGRWIGTAAAVAADPAAAVAGEQLRALMNVRRLDIGAPLRLAGGNRTVVAAIDATFSARNRTARCGRSATPRCARRWSASTSWPSTAPSATRSSR